MNNDHPVLLGSDFDPLSYNLVTWPDDRLITVSEPVLTIDEPRKQIAQRMLDIMGMHNGIGLAAVQIGFMERIIVMCTQGYQVGMKIEDPLVQVFFNAEIVNASKELGEMAEGCLSLPKQKVLVKRPQSVSARYLNLAGETCEREFTGLEATCLQHEIDHTNGVCIIEYASPAYRQLMEMELIALQKKSKR